MRTGCLRCAVWLGFLLPAALSAGDGTPQQWRFAGRFKDRPVLVAELRTGNFAQRRKELYTVQPKSPNTERINQFLACFPTSIVLAAWALGPRDSDLRYLVELNCPGKAPELGRLIGELMEPDPDTPAKPGVGTRTVTLADKTELTFTVEKDRVVLGSPERVKAFVAGGDATPYAWLNETIAKVNLDATGQALVLRLAGDLECLPDELRLPILADDSLLAGFLRVFGLDAVPSRFAGELILDEQRLAARVVSPLKTPAQGIASLLFPQPQPLILVDRIPDSVPLALFLPWKPLDRALKALGETERRWGEDIGKEFEEELADIKRDWGFDLGGDFLATFKEGAVAISLMKQTPQRLLDDKGGFDHAEARKDRPNILLLPCASPEASEALLRKAKAFETKKAPDLFVHRWQDGVLCVAGDTTYLDRLEAAQKAGKPHPYLKKLVSDQRHAGNLLFTDLRTLGSFLHGIFEKGAQESPVLAKRYTPPALRLLDRFGREGGVLLVELAGEPGSIRMGVEWLDTDPLKFISKADVDFAEWLKTAR